MQLNPDCVRDLLLEVERTSSYTTGLYLDTDVENDLFKKYSWSEIIYHIKQCNMANLITSALVFETDGYANVDDLTPDGHKFLSNIRSDDIWGKTKVIAKKIGSSSLDALAQVAGNVISTLILSYFK